MFRQVEKPSAFVSFLFHLLTATVGTLLMTGLSSLVLEQFVSRNVVSRVALGPTFLLPALLGGLLGYYCGVFFPGRWAMRVWIIPALLLVLNVARSLTSPYERKDIWVNEFGPQSRCTACLDETFLTVPLVGCLGYGVGARVRLGKSALRSE